MAAAKRTYASGTTVSIGRSQDEIKDEIARMGVNKRMIYEDAAGVAVVAFERQGVQYRITLPLPKPEDFRYTPGRRLYRDNDQMRAEWAQGCAERWRALAYHLKALRVAAEAHITTINRVLLPYAVVPGTNGATVEQWMEAQLPDAYAHNAMPPLLPGVGEAPRLLPAPTEKD